MVDGIQPVLAGFQPAITLLALTPACGRGFALAAFQAASVSASEMCIRIRAVPRADMGPRRWRW
jgi:hypothetical protein